MGALVLCLSSPWPDLWGSVTQSDASYMRHRGQVPAGPTAYVVLWWLPAFWFP
jgi:hypothetical protein